jgi:excinuclease UvrABC ATPase subunit
MPRAIGERGARHNNLQDVDVDVPLWRTVAVVGVSGWGKTSVGTMSEVLNILRLMMSRLGSHLCPNGHRIGPSVATLTDEITCPVCGARFEHPSAELAEHLGLPATADVP